VATSHSVFKRGVSFPLVVSFFFSPYITSCVARGGKFSEGVILYVYRRNLSLVFVTEDRSIAEAVQLLNFYKNRNDY